jgi:hypothetical protein
MAAGEFLIYLLFVAFNLTVSDSVESAFLSFLFFFSRYNPLTITARPASKSS